MSITTIAQKREEMALKYYRLAMHRVQYWIRKGCDSNIDELKSAAMYALAKCICRNQYDPNKSGFTTYLITSIDNEIRMYLRRYSKIFTMEVFFSQPIAEDGAGNIKTVEEVLGEEGGFDDIIKKIDRSEVLKKAPLTPRERRALALRLQGQNQRQIAEVLKISQPHVSRILSQISRRLNINELKEVIDA